MRSRTSFVIALSMLVLGPAVAIKVAMAEEQVPDPSTEANLDPTKHEQPAQPEQAEADSAPIPVIQEKPKPSMSRTKILKANRSPITPPADLPVQSDSPDFRRFGGAAQPSHRWQTGFAFMPGSGYRLIAPYQENQFCADRNGRAGTRVCTQFVPIFTEFQLSFGVTSGLDVLFDLRFGLGDEPVRPRHHALMLSPGIRFWLDRAPTTKFFSTLQFAYEYLDFSGFDTRSSDFGVRNANGLMFDLGRNLGLFVQVGETITLVRWFRIDLDVGLGLQLRLP